MPIRQKIVFKEVNAAASSVTKNICGAGVEKKNVKRFAKDRMNTAVRKYIKRLDGSPIVILNGIPPLIPHDCLPTHWPATIETAIVLAQKVFAMQGRRC
jgi:hypothetical protein